VANLRHAGVKSPGVLVDYSLVYSRLDPSLYFSAQSDGQPTIVLRAMGRAINKAVTIAEILKRKMPLHQWNALSSVEMIDVYEPIEEGLDVVTSRRYVSCMTITLSTTMLLGKMDTNHTGYQPPLAASEMQPRDFHHQQQQQQQQQRMVPTS